MENTELNLPLNGNPNPQRQPFVARAFGHIISVVFHPLFIPTYIVAYLLFLHPYAFAGATEKYRLFRLFSIIFITAFLPAFSIFLMRQLNFISSVMLRTQRDRIIPYVVSMIYYWWGWHVSKNLGDSPAMVAMLLGTFLISIAGMMANIYFKISMHGMAAGLLIAFFLWLSFNGTVAIGAYLAIATFITGLVCTARALVSDHTPMELYGGLFTGIACQLIAFAIAG